MRQTAQKKEQMQKEIFCQRNDTFPLMSSFGDWKNLLVNPHYQEALFSDPHYNFISTLDQQETNMKNWKGAANVNIIQLLGTNITQ